MSTRNTAPDVHSTTVNLHNYSEEPLSLTVRSSACGDFGREFVYLADASDTDTGLLGDEGLRLAPVDALALGQALVNAARASA